MLSVIKLLTPLIYLNLYNYTDVLIVMRVMSDKLTNQDICIIQRKIWSIFMSMSDSSTNAKNKCISYCSHFVVKA